MPIDKLRYGTSDLILLTELSIRPTYAYDLYKRLEDAPIKFSQRLIYPTLSRLTLDGRLSRRHDGRTVVYTLTPKGLKYLAAEITKWKLLRTFIDTRLSTLKPIEE